jgi:hypothetical protein
MFIVDTIKARWGTALLLVALGLLVAYEWRSAKQLAAFESPAHAAPRTSAPLVLAEGRVTTYPGRELTVRRNRRGGTKSRARRSNRASQRD